MLRRGLVLAVAVLALASAAEARAARPSDDVFGVNVNRVFSSFQFPGIVDELMWQVHDAGIRQARSDAFWMWAEPDAPVDGHHTYSWSTRLDDVARTLAGHGQRWLPVLDYSALWAASDASDYHSPPKDVADYAAYAGAFAKRYGRGGSYWAEHPDGALPVTTYEIWNEPNGAWFWRPKPDAAAYADMYLRARAAIKAVDPEAIVVVGGLVADSSFVDAMYAARPDLRGNVDAVGWHPYAPSATAAVASVRALRRALERVGDPDVPIHLTEVGWPTHGKGASERIVLSEPARAAALEATVETLARSDCGVEQISAYTWITPEHDPDDAEDWYGLRHTSGLPSESEQAFSRTIERWDSTPPPDEGRLPVCHPDSDSDGLLDRDDDDDDNDGVRDIRDSFPLDPAEQSDRDKDGVGDNADPDDDNDGSLDLLDAFPADPTEWRDSDLDGRGDHRDIDDDNDGLRDKAEVFAGLSPRDVDTDDDGIPDGAERYTSPRRADTDGDRIPDGVETAVTKPLPDPPGIVRGTNLARFHLDLDPRTRTSPLRADTDGDGIADGAEDRNHNGRRDRGETDPRRAARHRKAAR